MHPRENDWIDDDNVLSEWQRRARSRVRSARRDVRHRRSSIRVALAVLAIGIALALLGKLFEDRLPPPSDVQAPVLSEPVQVPINEPPFKARVGRIDYYVKPRYSYDIAGLVVSLHQSDAWWDLAHRDAQDYINLMDLCVVWGGNASSGIYHRISFSNSEWSCDFGSRSAADFSAFNLAQVSNNHLLAVDPRVVHTLRRIHVGDQVRLHGTLVDYGVIRDGATGYVRVSSDTRTDTGNGACEIIYVTSVELLTNNGTLPRLAFDLGLLLIVGGLVAWLALPLALADAKQGFDLIR